MEPVCAEHRASRRHRRCDAFLVALPFIVALVVSPPAVAQPQSQASLHLDGMTFVATRDNENELVLHAQKADLPPGAEVAKLQGVHMTMHNPGGTKQSFEMTCERGDLQLESADFHAEGKVEGRMADGRLIFTPRLDYDSERGMITSDAPVRLVEGDHTMRGRGFVYNVRSGHFVLRGGASVIQE